MRAGCLRGFLTVQRKIVVGSTSQSAFEPNNVWTDILSDIPCEVEVKRGREHFDQKTHERFSEDVWLFRTRYEELIGISSADRVVFDGMYFDIKSQRPDAQFRRNFLLECTTQNAEMQSNQLIAQIEETIHEGWVGEEYSSFTVTASGGKSPYFFSIASGSLPQGLSIEASTGVVSGVPIVWGDAAVTIEVVDADRSSFTLPEIIISISE